MNLNYHKNTSEIATKIIERWQNLIEQQPEPGCLYIVGTPIGNLNDLSLRALQVLAGVDFIAAEDTRHSLMLLNAFNIKSELISHHEHNWQKSCRKIIELLQNNHSVALVTDAGMPSISDPGTELSSLCHHEGIKVIMVPGATALTTAAAASGLISKEFTFLGFLDVNNKQRKVQLDFVLQSQNPVILYESPHRILKTLEELQKLGLGKALICVCRELTKIYEDIKMTTIDEFLTEFGADKDWQRGEFVLVIDCPKNYHQSLDANGAKILSEAEIIAKAEVLRAQGLKNKQIAKILATEINLSAKIVYNLLIK